jgi:hypothetical protein
MRATGDDMKILMYLLTFLCGLLGTLALLRTIELLAIGAGVIPVQVLLAVGMLTLAIICLRKARSMR